MWLVAALVAGIAMATVLVPAGGGEDGEALDPVASSMGSTDEPEEPDDRRVVVDRNATMQEGACVWLTPAAPYGACLGDEARVGWTFEEPAHAHSVELTLSWAPETPATEELNLRYRAANVTYITSGGSPLTLTLDQRLEGPHHVDVWWQPVNPGNVQAYAEQDVRLTGELVHASAE